MIIISPERFSKITQDNYMTHQMAEFIESVARQVNNNTTASGSGSPEGVLQAEPNKIYIDTTANTIYYKKTGSGVTGWQLT